MAQDVEFGEKATTEQLGSVKGSAYAAAEQGQTATDK